MKKIIYLILFLIVILAILWNIHKKERDKKIEIIEEEIPVEVAKVKEIIIKDEIECIGEIEPYQKVVIYSEISGEVENLNVKEGDYVKKGDFIAQIDYKKRKIDYENIENQIKATEVNLQNIKKDYERFMKLYKEGVISEKKLDDIKTSYEVISHQLESLKKQFELAKIRINEAFIYSPINGFIAEKFIDEGELITESSMMRSVPIVSIVDISKVKIILPIGSEEIGKVKIGQNVLIKIDAYPEKDFFGEVSKIYPIADEKTRRVNVEVIVENKNFLIKPGMYCKGIIIVGERKVISIPLDAVMKLPASGNYYCFKVKDNTAEKVYIKVGGIKENYIEIKEGLNKNDVVIVTSHGILDTGKKIKIIGEKI
ncbi:MAG: efflux RND transporter periplasmic adaptor subunit [Candidatus Omnitrophica bacterium]|nr:efflux RND transporter periplasmic adaptor subunit [Candidatus Omnitrophota bacterium]